MLISNALFILLCMLMMHIVDDYFLQGCLANLKQQSWWREHYPQPMYNKDYIAALICHAFSWTFCITLPCFVCWGFEMWGFLIFIANVFIHGYVDHLKANKRTINLIQDQLLHLFQIVLTFTIYLSVCG